MKQKLALCCALIHNPRLLVLDEPTTGVDAVSRKEFWESLHTLKENGMTILVSTPYMDEAEKCDRVALMQEGRIMEVNAPNVILSAFAAPLFEVRVYDRLKTLQILRLQREIKRAYLFGQCIHVASVNAAHGSEWINTQLVSEGITDAHINSVKPDFEDCFIELVEHEKPYK
jgi:ABC-type multidrug transport system ATPase subunit